MQGRAALLTACRCTLLYEYLESTAFVSKAAKFTPRNAQSHLESILHIAL
jgi:hypothetical protein